MPELPEVEAIKIGLSKLLPGKTITKAWHDWPKSFPNSPQDVKNFLIGAEVVEVKRRAKVLIIELSSKYSLIIHLKMTGQLVFVGKPQKQVTSNKKQVSRWGGGHPSDSLVNKLPDKSTRVIFCLDEGKGAALEPSARKQRSTERGVQGVRRLSTGATDTAIGQEHWRNFGLRPKAHQCAAHLFFNDQRKFGWVRLVPTAEISNIDFFKRVGPEPLAADFTAQDFINRLKRRPKSVIKAVLLDQTIVAGVGNIYADEALWAAKIHPSTMLNTISAQKLSDLYVNLRSILKLSIEKGGSTDKNYVDAEGKKGSYLSIARVFRKQGQPCPRCGTIIVKIRVAGRGTHICPHCQKESQK